MNFRQRVDKTRYIIREESSRAWDRTYNGPHTHTPDKIERRHRRQKKGGIVIAVAAVALTAGILASNCNNETHNTEHHRHTTSSTTTTTPGAHVLPYTTTTTTSSTSTTIANSIKPLQRGQSVPVTTSPHSTTTTHPTTTTTTQQTTTTTIPPTTTTTTQPFEALNPTVNNQYITSGGTATIIANVTGGSGGNAYTWNVIVPNSSQAVAASGYCSNYKSNTCTFTTNSSTVTGEYLFSVTIMDSAGQSVTSANVEVYLYPEVGGTASEIARAVRK